MGKSWLLKAEALYRAEALTLALQNGSSIEGALARQPIPIWVELSKVGEHLAEPDSARKPRDDCWPLIDAILTVASPRSESIRRLLHEQIDAGQVVFLLDALDEVRSVKNSSRETESPLKALERHFTELALVGAVEQGAPDHGCRLLLTSRIAGFAKANIGRLEATQFELLPFDPGTIKTFVESWFNGSVEESSSKASQFHKELIARPQVHGLVQTPLFLALLCELFDRPGSSEESFPSRKVDILEASLRYLIEEWTKKKTGMVVAGVDAILSILGALAFEALRSEQDPTHPHAKGKDWIKAKGAFAAGRYTRDRSPVPRRRSGDRR